MSTGRSPSNQDTQVECCFLDVGQGTCSIITLGENRAIVIDCGPKGAVPVRALKHFGISQIEALIVSHNDSDHWGGATRILTNYPKAIERIYFLDDRPASQNRFLELVKRELEVGNLLRRPERLEARYQDQFLYRDVARDVSLRVLFPEFMDNLQAPGPNDTSAVLVLKCGKRRLLFPGDLMYPQWATLRDRIGGKFRCDAMSAPHHGGSLTDHDSSRRHQWIYEEAVHCGVCVLSVGTSNGHGHPNPDHIRGLHAAGVQVVCTQITERCCEASHLEDWRRGWTGISDIPGDSSRRSRSTSSAGRSKQVACAGSVLVGIGRQSVTIQRIDEHRARVDRLSNARYGHPLCLS